MLKLFRIVNSDVLESSPRQSKIYAGRLKPKDGVIRGVLRNLNNCLPFVTVKHPIRPKFSKNTHWQL